MPVGYTQDHIEELEYQVDKKSEELAKIRGLIDAFLGYLDDNNAREKLCKSSFEEMQYDHFIKQLDKEI